MSELTRGQIEEVIRKHMRHIELSPAAGKVAQDYAIATCEDILTDLAALRSEPSDEPVACPIGEVLENGVTWLGKYPHEFPVGTKFYTRHPRPVSEPQPDSEQGKGER